jgi:hypothetical protein
MLAVVAVFAGCKPKVSPEAKATEAAVAPAAAAQAPAAAESIAPVLAKPQVVDPAIAAEIAEEEKLVQKAVSGWKARAYRPARNGAIFVVFEGLAKAADQAGKHDLAALHPKVQEAAELAAKVSEDLGRPPLANGQPDWAGISADMSKQARNPSPPVNLMLALVLILSGDDTLALVELQAMDAQQLNARDRQALGLLRSSAYRLHGCRQLAERDIEMLFPEGEKADPDKNGVTLQACLHLCVGVAALKARDYEAVDMEIARATRAWPNNPVVVFLTGEKQAASGDYEKAAESLESALPELKEKDPELFALITQRVREVRDKKGKAEPIFYSKESQWALMKHLYTRAERDLGIKQTDSWLSIAQTLGKQLVDQIPGIGNKAEPAVTPPAP